jgi:hypothetical protein
MKSRILALLIFTAVSMPSFCQDNGTGANKKWNYNVASNFYFFSDDFFVLPVFKADKNRLHFEARYNYEDRETFSAWAGYNFFGGDAFTYAITPMVGAAAGRTKGLITGVEFEFGWKRFELYSELEYLFDADTNENNFFYGWTDLTFSPADWWWLGISGQRTRLFETSVEIEHGILVGAAWKSLEISTYVYNFTVDEPFVLVSLAANF